MVQITAPKLGHEMTIKHLDNSLLIKYGALPVLSFIFLILFSAVICFFPDLLLLFSLFLFFAVIFFYSPSLHCLSLAFLFHAKLSSFLFSQRIFPWVYFCISWRIIHTSIIHSNYNKDYFWWPYYPWKNTFWLSIFFINSCRTTFLRLCPIGKLNYVVFRSVYSNERIFIVLYLLLHIL